MSFAGGGGGRSRSTVEGRFSTTGGGGADWGRFAGSGGVGFRFGDVDGMPGTDTDDWANGCPAGTPEKPGAGRLEYTGPGGCMPGKGREVHEAA